MQSLTSRQRDPLQVFATQQRFSFGKSSEEFYAPRRYRAAWISDAHLGTRGCNATALLDFFARDGFRHPLHRGRPDRYLVAAARNLLATATQRRDPKNSAQGPQGARVIYIPGNHDELVTSFCGVYGNIEIKENALHVT